MLFVFKKRLTLHVVLLALNYSAFFFFRVGVEIQVFFFFSFFQDMSNYDTVVVDIEGTITPITFVKETLVNTRKKKFRVKY